MGTASPALRVPLGEGRSRRPALFTGAHHPCLGFRRALPYSAHRGKKSVNRQALDDLKQQIPLMGRSEEHTSELQSLRHLVCRLLLEKKKKNKPSTDTYLVNIPSNATPHNSTSL